MTTEIPEIFRALLEHPFTLPNFDDNDTDKEKLGIEGNPDSVGGGSDMGPSAALTPAIWEKTIPYDGESFHSEYMDSEEFLMENGIPTSPGDPALKEGPAVNVSRTEKVKPKPAGGSPVSSSPIPESDRCEEEVVIITKSDSDVTSDVNTEVTTSQERATPEPINPDEIEVDVNYEPDPTDSVSSSVPGGESFDPRKHKFSEEELKPQPMIKKAKKVFVPEEQKDEKYWQRRKKNNMAAKRSRDARRLKENQITVRAAFSERENAASRSEVADSRKECGRYKNVVGRYEAKYGRIAPPDDE